MSLKIPSEVHQLLITVSRHFHIGSKGQIRYQNKPMEITLKKLEKSDRNHLVHYILRDEASGFFYAELCSHKDLIPNRGFLLRGWFIKKSSTFCGVPKSLVVTKTIVDHFGDGSYSDLLAELNIKSSVPDSGFSTGVRVIKDWEDDIYFRAVDVDDDEELRSVANWNPMTTAFFSNVKSFRYSKFYRTKERLVPNDDYETLLIGKYASKDFKKTDLFPTIETVADLRLILKPLYSEESSK